MVGRSRLRRLALSMSTLGALLLLILLSGLPPGARRAHAAADVASCAPDTGSASISGAVTAPGGAPLNLVLVTAYTIYGDRGGYAYTNASGNYTINGLIGGAYILKFEGTGIYATEWNNNQSSPIAAAATPINVPEGGAISGINAELNEGARFSGTVTGSGSSGLGSVRVNVYDAAEQLVAGAYTDGSGNYTTAPGLPNGAYRIQFDDAGGFLGEWYNDKPSFATATPLNVTAPGVRSGINAVLARGGAISGRVTDAGGSPLSGIYVTASGSQGYGYSLTDGSGNYTINGLRSGNYEVRAASLSDSTNLVGSRRAATVIAPDTTPGINLTMTPGGTLTGRVTDGSGTALNGITVFIRNEDGSYQKYVYTNDSGVYTATGLPTGTYRVLFRPHAHIPEAYNDRPDFGQADPISVVAPNTVSGIDAVLAPGSAISGRVTDATTSAPIKDVFVEILDAGGGRVETAFTQADGTYRTATTLPSGSYRVRFNADERFASCAYVTAYYNGKSTFESADPVVVTAPTERTGIDARLQRGSIIFGNVTDATTGAPITRGQVTIYDSTGRHVMFGRLTFLGGWHTETGLPSGSYRVKFEDHDQGYIDEWYDDKPSLETATPVVLNAPTDRYGINAALARGGLISGRVTGADTGLPFSDGYVLALDSSGNEAGYADINEDGMYVVRSGLASGNYRVAVVPYGYGEGVSDSTRRTYIVSYYRGTSAPGPPANVVVTAPNTTTNIDIAMLYGQLLPLVRR